MRPFLFILGILCIVLGTIGIILPLIPTTPFLLLAAWCFGKSSEKWSKWLNNHKIFGKFLRNFSEKKGIHKRHKIVAYITIAVTFSSSIYLAPQPIFVYFLLPIGICLTIMILCFKTIED